MAALVAGEGVPVLVEQVVEDAGFDFAGGLGGVAVGIALFSGEGVGDDCRAVGIDGGGKDDAFAIGRPPCIVGVG